MSKDFSTVNVRIVGSGGVDNVVDKAREKLKGFGEKFDNHLESAKDLFSSSDGGFGTISKVAGMASGIAGPIGLAAMAVSTVVTGLKSAYDWYKEFDKTRTDAAATKKAEDLEAKMAPIRRMNEAESSARQSLVDFNVALTKQIELFGKAANEAALYTAKKALVKTGVLTNDEAFNPEFVREQQRAFEVNRTATQTKRSTFGRNNWPIEETDIRRSKVLFNPAWRNESSAFQDLRRAEFMSKLQEDRERAAQMSAEAGTTSTGLSKKLSDASRLKNRGLLTGGEYARTAMNVLEQAERLSPPVTKNGQLTSGLNADSAEAASFFLQSQARGVETLKDPLTRLTEALERLRLDEEARQRDGEKLTDAIDKGLGLFIAQF